MCIRDSAGPERSDEMKSYRKVLEMNVPTRRGYRNITPQVEQALAESGIREGLVLVNAMNITASVFINDDESGLHQDFETWLEKLAPEKPYEMYHHNGCLLYTSYEQTMTYAHKRKQKSGSCRSFLHGELFGDAAVSYTHLDVYKRQAFIRIQTAARAFRMWISQRCSPPGWTAWPRWQWRMESPEVYAPDLLEKS